MIMSDFWIVFLIAAGAIAIFIVAMSLTLLFKGHHIKSEIGDNEAMRKRGIKCVLHEERDLYGGDQEGCGCGAPKDCGEPSCSSRSQEDKH